MLGTKRTVPLWRQKQRRLLTLERALAPGKPAHETHVEQIVISAKAAQRRVHDAKRKLRFSEAS